MVLENARQHVLEAVDRSSPIPLYLQVKETLLEKIESGEWPPEQQLPSEVELCDLLEVSRAVVRQALNELVFEGFIIREQGRGTFVAKPKMDFQPSTLISFSRVMRSLGHEVKTKVLDKSIIVAPKKVADKLSLKPEDKVVLIRRLRFVDDQPVAIHTAYLDSERFAALVDEDMSQSLWDAIQKITGIDSAYTQDIIEATTLRREEAELLDRSIGSSALLIAGNAFDNQGRPFRYTEAVNRADCIRFVIIGGLVQLQFGDMTEPLASAVPSVLSNPGAFEDL
jgi:GntR family transcriptional regulator